MIMPLVSIVVAVFNKEKFLLGTLASLFNQQGRGVNFDIELVIVDDLSTDASLVVCEKFVADVKCKSVIIKNNENRGPAIRTNQGIEGSSGDYVFIFDADDVAPGNVILSMLGILQSNNLDYVYGRSAKTGVDAEAAARMLIPLEPLFHVGEDPLAFTLDKKIVLPIVLAKKQVMLQSGCCDPLVFIQDESLALRLSLVAKRMAIVEHPCRYVLVSEEEEKTKKVASHHLSANLNQQHHDQFLTYVHLLDGAELSVEQRRKIAKKAFSPWWKSSRIGGFKARVFALYIMSKIFPVFVFDRFRRELEEYFYRLPNVRRVGR